jgi:acyl carrier protein
MTGTLQKRLVQCFSAVFSNRSPEEILSADRESLPEWDSLASLTLLALIQEEFRTELDLFDLERLNSFQAMQKHLEEQEAASSEDARHV